MKKKISILIIALLCIASIFLLVACSDESVTKPNEQQQSAQTSGLTVSDYQEYDYERTRLSHTDAVKFQNEGTVDSGLNEEVEDVENDLTVENVKLTAPEIHFLNGQKGEDCTIVVLPNGEIMLYNVGSGDAEFGNYLKSYLTGMKVSRIDHVIISDYDDSRIGQLAMLAEEFDTSRTVVYVKGSTLKNNQVTPIHTEMKELQAMDAHAYDNFMSVMRISRESYGSVTFINQENSNVTVGGMDLEFFNVDYSTYKDYRDWTMCCRMSYNYSSVLLLGGVTSDVLDRYATELKASNVVRVSGHLKDSYSKEFYEKVATDMTVSQLAASSAKDVLIKSWLQNILQQQGIDSYVTGFSNSEIVIQLSGDDAKVINGAKPAIVEFEGFWTEWVD